MPHLLNIFEKAAKFEIVILQIIGGTLWVKAEIFQNVIGNKSKVLKLIRLKGCKLSTLSGLPPSGKKFWKMKKKFLGQEKVRELHFQSGEIIKNEKSPGKVREFQNFPKKMLS